MKIDNEALAKIEADVVALVSGSFKFSELVSVVEDIIALVRTMGTITTSEEAVVEAKEIWKFVDSKYGIIQKIDDMVKLPSIAESLDSMLIGLLINSVIIPYGIAALWKL